MYIQWNITKSLKGMKNVIYGDVMRVSILSKVSETEKDKYL